ncbi:MAG: hypothetical protein RR756_04430, partial [Cetobacterium sp.]
MNKVNMMFISLLILSGCTSAPYDNRNSGLDMNLVANTILATSLYNHNNNNNNFNSFNNNFNTQTKTHKTSSTTSNTVE